MDQDQIKTIGDICKQFGISYLGMFGSYARGDNKPDSDVDLLVEYGERKSLFDHVRIQRQFSEMLHKNVDLVTKRSLHPYIKDYVYKDLRALYEER